MDNLTHSLAGLVLGETVHQASGCKEDRRLLVLTASVLANNFPDLDLIYTSIAPAPLGYLLHHRGHTHTLGAVVPQLLIILAFLFLIPPFRRLLRDRQNLILAAGTAALGLCVHVLMDGWNSYGIHPFWPFSSRWIYGDAIFILEPMIWVGFSMPLFFALRGRVVRWIVGTLIYGIPVAAWGMGLLRGYSLVAIALVSLILWAAVRSLRSTSARIGLGLGFVIFFLAIQFTASSRVRERLTTEFNEVQGHRRLLEVITEPQPANPICWRSIRLTVNQERGVYRAVLRGASAWPALIADDDCLIARPGDREVEISLAKFNASRDRDCEFDAWLSFARAPMIDGQDRAYDLRFGSAQEPGFSDLTLAREKRDCPAWLTRWDRPRQDLVDEAAAALIPSL